ncbi:uncharacterized protein BDFB_001231 [Asbolus verrucosus]|uniref:PBP GOBP domain containing protein n=1 Tax=Asbolus verrucosus TaxID=1661398 RepID=A0A482V8X8_ASBVE|nr:uncharacterized protein BDFB_001231 [Asbolus verrucosus]
MRAIVLFALTIIHTEAFDCGIHMNRNEVLKAIINRCVNSNKTLEDLWDMNPMSSESDSSSSSEEELAVDGKMMQTFRTRRSNVKHQEPNRYQLPDPTNDTDSEQNNTTESSHSGEGVAENCIIQCIFENLEMADSNGYPLHDKILEGLLKNVTGRELHDFLQDSTDDCFQEMDKEPTMDPCSYSIKLVTCLADKGKSNCADWPVGELPFHH